MKIIKAIADIFFLTRPVLFVPVWGFSLLGFYKYHWLMNKTFPLFEMSKDFMSVLIKIMIFTFSVGAVNIINQISDIEADKANDGFSVFQKSGLSVLIASLSALFFSLISVLVPLILNWKLIHYFSIAAILIGLVYSLRPTYFTGRPFLDFITNALGFGAVAFAVGWVLAGGDISDFWFAAIPYILLMCAGSISSTLPDIKGDKVGGKNTTAVFLGEFNAHVLATLFIVAAVIFSWFTKDFAALIAGGISLPFYLLFIINKTEFFKEATYKIGGSLLMLIVAIMYPLFIPFSIILFVATLVYFRLRFHVSYPSLIPVKE